MFVIRDANAAGWSFNFEGRSNAEICGSALYEIRVDGLFTASVHASSPSSLIRSYSKSRADQPLPCARSVLKRWCGILLSPYSGNSTPNEPTDATQGALGLSYVCTGRRIFPPCPSMMSLFP